MDVPRRRQVHRPCHGMGARLATFLLCGTAILADAEVMPKSHTVVMEAVRFSPPGLEVRAGDIVAWTNRDAFPHNVTADPAQFHSPDVAPGQTWKFTARKRGRFAYVCTLHPGMKAVLVVK